MSNCFCHFNKKPGIYEKARQQLTKLNLLPLKQLSIQHTNNQSEPETISQSQIFSSRRYLMKQMGLSVDELEWFEAERKVNKLSIKVINIYEQPI